MRNGIRLALGFVLATCIVAPSEAQVWGQFTGAEAVASGSRMGGGYLTHSENVLGVLGQLRLSFYPNVDFGFQGGLARLDFATQDRTTIRLGGDIKVRLSEPTASLPATMSLGVVLGVETGDDITLLTVGPTLIASRAYGMGQGGNLTPYGRIGLAITTIDVGLLNDTDVSVPVFLGAELAMGAQLRLSLELQFRAGDSFNDDLGIGAGVNVPF